MALEVVERVTERFFRGDAARPRGGLGLTGIAQNVCSSKEALYKLIVKKEKNRRYPFFYLLLPTTIG